MSMSTYLKDLAAQWLGKAARGYAKKTLHVLDHRRWERQLPCLLHDILGRKVILHHELRQVANNLARRRYLREPGSRGAGGGGG